MLYFSKILQEMHKKISSHTCAPFSFNKKCYLNGLCAAKHYQTVFVRYCTLKALNVVAILLISSNVPFYVGPDI